MAAHGLTDANLKRFADFLNSAEGAAVCAELESRGGFVEVSCGKGIKAGGSDENLYLTGEGFVRGKMQPFFDSEPLPPELMAIEIPEAMEIMKNESDYFLNVHLGGRSNLIIWLKEAIKSAGRIPSLQTIS